MSDIILLDEAIVVKWAPRNKGHYTDLGYMFTGFGKEFSVRTRDLPPTSKYKVMVRCPVCMEEREVQWANVVRNSSTICTKCSAREASFNDLTGQSFGRLKVISFAGREEGTGKARWSCLCECGVVKDIDAWALLSGNTMSCGCLRSEVARELLASRTGEENPMWDPTKTDEDRDSRHRSTGHKHWREAVFEKDGRMCVKCDSEEDLHAHHILPYSDYPDKREDVDNGITLCKKCHDKFHSGYGLVGVSDVELALFLTEP